MHICKNCFESYNGKPEVCPHCGAAIEYKSKKKKEHKLEENEQTEQLDLNQDQTLQESQNQDQIEQQPKKRRKRRWSDKEIMESIDFDDLLAQTNDSDVKSWKEKRKKKDRPEVTKTEDGFDVDIRDVSYMPNTYTYSAKKARGEYQKPDIKWWEIYKWADLLLVRRKIKKQVNRASHYRPSQFSLGVSITLCVLFGWMGAHDFYARNWRKGLFVLFCAIFGSVVVFHPAFSMVRISIGGGLWFIDVFLWVFDLINLCWGHYAYRLSKWKFIDSLNTDTRAKLGYKYVDKDEYKRHWTVRLVHSIKRASAERKDKRKNKDKSEQSQNEQPAEETKQETSAEQTEQKSAKQSKNKNNNSKKQTKLIKINKYKKN